MSVRRRAQKGKKGISIKWIVDFNFHHADGRCERIRKVSPVQTRRGAEVYDRQLREALLRGQSVTDIGTKLSSDAIENCDANGVDEGHLPNQNPCFASHAEEFLQVYASVHNKPSEVASKESILRVHLLPSFGTMQLDEIKTRAIETYTQTKKNSGLAAKTINNQLAVLGRCLQVAVEWGLLATMPKIRLLPLPLLEFHFLRFEEADGLIAASDGKWRVMCVIALRAGLRLGELRALRWRDVDMAARKLVIRQAAWKKTVGAPKSGKMREVALSNEAHQALMSLNRTAGPLVFCDKQGDMLTKESCKWPLWRACNRAGLNKRIGWHVLRHTFASHLVMRGASMKAIQELLGHSDIKMTMRYAHLSAHAKREAIALLDGSEPAAPKPSEAFSTCH